MHARDILHYGHQEVVHAVDKLESYEWYIPGAAGAWCVKDIIAHLASFEQVLVEVLGHLVDGRPTPTLERRAQLGLAFNDDEVIRRKERTAEDVFTEYVEAYAQVMGLIEQLPPEQLTQDGLLAWYGAEYDLEDYLVYTYYGHKREHSAQINAITDSRARRARRQAQEATT